MNKNKKLAKKDKHHISWKNHGIDQYIIDALREYLKKINKKNIDKGINTFNKSVQAFGDLMDQLSKEIDSPKKGRANGKSSRSNVKIWSDSPRKKSKSQRTKDQINIEKIWGKRK